MVEFAETAMRHYCRNPKCRSKLKTPVSNSREAFCPDTTCKQRFYRLRCYVCEEEKSGRLDAHTCGRRKCKNAIRSLKRPQDTSRVEIGLKKSINTGLPEGDKYGRRWVQIAGPALTPSQLHCATVPDGPNCQWTDGSFERIEAENRRLLEQHFATLDAMATDHCVPCGTGEDLVDHKPNPTRPERTVTLCRTCRDKGRNVSTRPDPGMMIPDDLTVPAFLRRVSA
jgi:hypothetical protein